MTQRVKYPIHSYHTPRVFLFAQFDNLCAKHRVRSDWDMPYYKLCKCWNVYLWKALDQVDAQCRPAETADQLGQTCPWSAIAQLHTFAYSCSSLLWQILKSTCGGIDTARYTWPYPSAARTQLISWTPHRLAASIQKACSEMHSLPAGSQAPRP